MHTILITGAGGGGGNNLIRSLRNSNLDVRIIGTNCLSQAVAKSNADQSFLLPEASDPRYLPELNRLIHAEGVDLVIPNNDRESGFISDNRDAVETRTFMPDQDAVRLCQDKNRFYAAVSEVGMTVAPTVMVTDLDRLEETMDGLPPSDRYWVRPRTGSGSKGATWVKTPAQARKWIELWHELRGFRPTDFQIATFLPGRDYNVQTIWLDGELRFLSMVERLAYYGGENRLSGMASTPAIARTINVPAAIENALAIIRHVDPKATGSFNVDMKGSVDGVANVTEINVGRFPMITTIHDANRRMNGVETYVRSALGLPFEQDGLEEIEEGWLMLRELDTEPLVIHERELQDFDAEELRARLSNP